MESSVSVGQINGRLLVAASLIIPWFAVRETLWASPSGLSVLMEWIGLIAMTVGMLCTRTRALERLGVPIGVGLCILFSISIADRQTLTELSLRYPEYWWGFGGRVLVVALFVALVATAAIQSISKSALFRDGRGYPKLRRLKTLVSLGVIGWTLPSVLQPMDAWLNLGDSTEKVLDEITGWTVGNFPGVHTSWAHGALLGLPLAPLSFINGYGGSKVVIVALYANALVVATPVLMGIVIHRVLPAIGRLPSFSLALIAVSISGSPGNSSLFQELSFLARGLLPVALGAVVVYAIRHGAPISCGQAFGCGVFAGIVLLNNFEYGIGAALAAITVTVCASPSNSAGIRLARYLGAGLLSAVLAFTLPALVDGGMWWSRRLGAWSDVLAGSAGEQSNNSGSWPPSFGLATLCFVVGVAGVSAGIRVLRMLPTSERQFAAAVSCTYFGIWVVASAPYFLNSGSAGAFRTQFYFIPFVLLAFSLLGLVIDQELSARGTKVAARHWLSSSLSRLPIVVLCSVALAAVIQVPNGLMEWQRVQTPNVSEKTEDEWSPKHLDWIQTSKVVELAHEFGGSDEVGWWFSYGNAVEALTGIENLLGVTGFETTRSRTQLSLACEPLKESAKSLVISIDGMTERLRSCGFPSVRALTPPNEDGLVVYEVARG